MACELYCKFLCFKSLIVTKLLFEILLQMRAKFAMQKLVFFWKCLQWFSYLVFFCFFKFLWITLLVDLVGCRSIDVSNRVVFKMHFLYFKVPIDKLLVYWRLYEAPTKALIKYVCVFFVWHYCPLDLSLSANQLAPKRQHTPNDFSVLAKSFSVQETRREKIHKPRQQNSFNYSLHFHLFIGNSLIRIVK